MPCPPVPRGRKEYQECKEFPAIQAAPKVRKESKAMMGRSGRKESRVIQAALKVRLEPMAVTVPRGRRVR